MLVLLLVLPAALGAGAVTYYQYRQHEAAAARLHAAVAWHNNAVAAEQAAAARLSDSVSRLRAAHVKLDSAINAVVTGSQQCLTVTCFDTTAVNAANASETFLRTFRGISFPPGVSPAVQKFEKDAVANAQAWLSMSHAVSFTDFEDRAARAEKSGRAFDHDYPALGKALDQVEASIRDKVAALNREADALRRRGEALNVPVHLLTPSVPTEGPSLA